MQLVVHRGTNIKSPENSISGIREIRNYTRNAIIEIDIAPTKDGRLVLSHDLSLTKMCGIDSLIFDYTFEELNKIQNRYEYISLDEVLSRFYDQKFLLDIRCSYHVDFFPGSDIDITAIEQNITDYYTKGIEKLLARNVIIMCSDISFAEKISSEWGEDVEVSENWLRDHLNGIEKTKKISCLRIPVKRVHIQNRLLTTGLIDVFHRNGIQVYSTPSGPRSLENSCAMLKKAQTLKCDGVWLSPIDDNIVKECFQESNI